MDLFDFHYRRESISLKEIFPKLDERGLRSQFHHLADPDPHRTILNAALELWDGGYGEMLERWGFHDPRYGKFSGHCHQITPALGAVLKALGFAHVAYLEARRVDPRTWEPVAPEAETDPAKQAEWCEIGRIPYCCLEIDVGGELFYVSGKHIKRMYGKPAALLTPACYRAMTGVFSHPADPQKSGIYLDPIRTDPLIWRKQQPKDSSPEFFKCFAHMELKSGL